MADRIIICGGDYARLEARSDCPNTLHDWPLPEGYGDASTMADSRISQRWANKRCPDCGLYGWVPGRFAGLAADSCRVEAPPITDVRLPEIEAPHVHKFEVSPLTGGVRCASAERRGVTNG